MGGVSLDARRRRARIARRFGSALVALPPLIALVLASRGALDDRARARAKSEGFQRQRDLILNDRLLAPGLSRAAIDEIQRANSEAELAFIGERIVQRLGASTTYSDFIVDLATPRDVVIQPLELRIRRPGVFEVRVSPKNRANDARKVGTAFDGAAADRRARRSVFVGLRR